MGRLTLNVLLSFAQFEREVTAERIRDKIAASKKKGLWMGGTVPFGYGRHPDPQRRELVRDPQEAGIVLQLFDLYAEHGNLRSVEENALQQGLRPRASTRPGAQKHPAFTRGQLHYLLTNPVYIGRIRHKAQSHPGQHPTIISQELWDRVQAGLLAARSRPRGRSDNAAPRPLIGKLRDDTGDLLTPSHTQSHGRRFCYYVSRRLIAGGGRCHRLAPSRHPPRDDHPRVPRGSHPGDRRPAPALCPPRGPWCRSADRGGASAGRSPPH